MIEARDLCFSYGRGEVIRSVNLRIDRGETVAIVGSNGAGKTTLLRVLAGILPLGSGVINLDGMDVSHEDSHIRVRRGITLVPEGRQLFGPLTVQENMLLGTYHRHRTLSAAVLRAEFEGVLSLFPILQERRNQPAKTLSGGEQQMLAIARGLLSSPKVLLLDEPSLGLAPKVKQQIFQALRDIQHRRDLTILVVEQDVRLALKVASRGYVLHMGRIVTSDTAANLLTDPILLESYLGSAANAEANPGP